MTDSTNSVKDKVENLTTWLLPKDDSDDKEAVAGERLRETVVQGLLSLITEAETKARKEERQRVRGIYAKKKPLYTKQWVADLIGVSRPTLNKWIENPEMFTIGAINQLAALKETHDE